MLRREEGGMRRREVMETRQGSEDLLYYISVTGCNCIVQYYMQLYYYCVLSFIIIIIIIIFIYKLIAFMTSATLSFLYSVYVI